MRVIIVDDEERMRKSFRRLSEGIENFKIVGDFENSESALAFARDNRVDLAFLDIEMPEMTGLELATKLRALKPDMLIVFVTAFEEYIGEANHLGADYYILKPYKKETLQQVVSKMKILSSMQQKDIYIQTFGRFVVKKDGKAIKLTGKAKEILALVVTRRGKEISNEELYSTIWEGRPYGNIEMKVYYNAVKRLKRTLANYGISDLLLSTVRGQAANTDLFDCDYYAWQDGDLKANDRFEGEFMSEYSWGEYLLADIITRHINK